MLSIKINGKNVILNQDFSFSINRENPIFNDPETLAGDYIESMTFPIKGNQHIFKNIHRISSNIKETDYEISIFYNGYHLITGIFTIKSAGEDYVTGDTKLNALSFFYKIKDLRMPDISDSYTYVLGFIQEDIENNINNISNGYPTYTDFPFVFPYMLNKDFYDNPDDIDFTGDINAYNIILQKHQFGDITQKKYPFVPCPYLKYLMETIVKEQKYSIKFPDYSLLSRLILATNKSMDYVEAKYSALTYAFTILYHYVANSPAKALIFYYNLYNDETIMYDESTNKFIIQEDGTYKINFRIKRTVNGEVQDTQSVNYVLNDSIDSIFQNNQEIELKRGDTIYFYNMASSSSVDYDIQYHGELNIINKLYFNSCMYNGIVRIREYVPDIEQIKIFSILKNLFNAGFYVNDGKREIEMITFNEIMGKKAIPIKINISEEYTIEKEEKGFLLRYGNSYTSEEQTEITLDKLTYSEVPEMTKLGTYAYVANEGSIYLYDITDNENAVEWYFFNLLNQEHKDEKDNMISFEIPFSLTNMNLTEANYLRPQLSGKATSPLNKKNDAKDFFVLIYHGKQFITDSGWLTGVKGPLASITNRDGHGNIISSYSLLIDDITKQFYQSFINFIGIAREITFTAKMKITDFMKLRLQEKYTSGGYTFIIKTMQMTIEINGYSFVEMTIAMI